MRSMSRRRRVTLRPAPADGQPVLPSRYRRRLRAHLRRDRPRPLPLHPLIRGSLLRGSLDRGSLLRGSLAIAPQLRRAQPDNLEHPSLSLRLRLRLCVVRVEDDVRRVIRRGRSRRDGPNVVGRSRRDGPNVRALRYGNVPNRIVPNRIVPNRAIRRRPDAAHRPHRPHPHDRHARAGHVVEVGHAHRVRQRGVSVVRRGRHQPRVVLTMNTRETHLGRLHRPSRVVVHGVPIVEHDARSRHLEPLLGLAVLLEVARHVRARQAGGARAGVALDHELQDLRRRFLQPLRGGRREGLAEQRLEILRPRQALLGLEVGSRGAVRAAFVRAARAPLGGRLRRGTLRRAFPAWRVVLTRRRARRARALVVVVAGGALLLGGV
mmetsp:Transcript_1271/g.4756  ORF Transcript_1271/g.4756 Transcript_1271/m.4756 type:complete len:378 (+) Transcript_1271:63-1196(+)